MTFAPIIAFLKRIPGWVWAVVIFVIFLKVKEGSDRKDERQKVETENREQTRQTMEAIEEESDDFTATANRIRARKPVRADPGELPDARAGRVPGYHYRED